MSNELAELKRKSLDTIRVHNPTMEDKTIHWDRFNTNVQWIIPAANKDSFGCGRGNRDVPRYIAVKFMEEMADHLMSREGSKEWDKLVSKLNIPENEYHMKEEKMMTSYYQNEKLKDEFRQKIWIGLVQRYGDIQAKPEEFVPEDRAKSDGQRAIDRLGLDEKVVDSLIEQIEEKDA